LNFFGADGFTYSIGDGNGGTDGATVTITINAVNDPPTANDDVAVTDEDTAVTIDVLANDSDVDGDALTIASASDPANGSVVINADGTITYTPDVNFFGADAFTYSIGDGNGGIDSATVSITVISVGEQISDLKVIVQQLVDEGSVNFGNGNAMQKKLDQIARKAAEGQTKVALNNLAAFVNSVISYIDEGILEPLQTSLGVN
jgi:hypothetical protein